MVANIVIVILFIIKALEKERVLGRKTAKHHQFPWRAVLEGKYKGGELRVCEGTVISPWHILSSEKCIQSEYK